MSKRRLVFEKRNYMQSPGPKPAGFWYGIGRSWHEWVESEMPHWMSEFNYEVDLGKSKILVINSIEGLDRFTKKYGRGEYHIDWVRVSEMYDGIEISPYQWSRRLSLMWYYGWDIASGCLWNLEQVAIREIQIEHEGKLQT